MSYALALGDVKEQLLSHGIVLRVRFSMDRTPWAHPDDFAGDSEASSDRDLLDVTFVDDEAIFIHSSYPSTSAKHFELVICVLRETLPRYNMEINWSKGKTEA